MPTYDYETLLYTKFRHTKLDSLNNGCVVRNIKGGKISVNIYATTNFIKYTDTQTFQDQSPNSITFFIAVNRLYIITWFL